MDCFEQMTVIAKEISKKIVLFKKGVVSRKSKRYYRPSSLKHR